MIKNLIFKAIIFVFGFVLTFCPTINKQTIALESVSKDSQNINQVVINGKSYNSEAEAMVIMEANSGRIFGSKAPDKQLPMASLTKIITAIVAIENCQDLDQKYEIPKEAVGIEGSSIYLKAGEHLSIRELLYGLMLRSGNDAAVAIATIIGGSVENFMQTCNDFCKKIGAENTNLVTPNGLHADNHYTTACDLAKISQYALKNKTFADVVSTQRTSISNEKGKYDHRDLINKNRFLKMIDGADGIKTGYTRKAGRCFVGSYTREEDGMQLVCVLLNCQPMFQECKMFTEIVRDTYKMYDVLGEDGYTGSITINKSDTKTDYVKSNNSFRYPLTLEEFDRLEFQDTLSSSYDAPITKGQKLGEIKIFLDKQLIFCDNIYSINDIKDNTYKGALDKLIDKF